VGKRWDVWEGKRWKDLGKTWGKGGKNGKIGKGWDGFEVLKERWEFGWRNREFQLGKTLDFRCSAKSFNQNA
jgi:pyridoxine/pyridoxamine 5'-phosphate oxidase